MKHKLHIITYVLTGIVLFGGASCDKVFKGYKYNKGILLESPRFLE